MMEYKGTLQRWNDEKGFGFVASENARQRDVFIHISELRNMSRRPVDGDVIFYQIYTDSVGKVKAVNARIEGVSFVKPSKKYTYKQNKQQNNSFLTTLLNVIFWGGMVWFAYGKFKGQKPVLTKNDVTDTYQTSEQKLVLNPNKGITPNSYENTPQDLTSKPNALESTSVNQNSTENIKRDESKYHCDGRQHCSQMTSCAEATFFINNCPDTKMDGDRDGIPCEEQWCDH